MLKRTRSNSLAVNRALTRAIQFAGRSTGHGDSNKTQYDRMRRGCRSCLHHHPLERREGYTHSVIGASCDGAVQTSGLARDARIICCRFARFVDRVSGRPRYRDDLSAVDDRRFPNRVSVFSNRFVPE